MPGICRRQTESCEGIRNDIRSRGEVFTGCAARFMIPSMPFSMSEVFHPAMAMYSIAEAASDAENLVFAPISRAFARSWSKSSPVAPEMAEPYSFGIEISCGLHRGSAKTRYGGSYRQELLADIFHRRSDVLELFSGFIDLGKRRICSGRLVL